MNISYLVTCSNETNTLTDLLQRLSALELTVATLNNNNNS